MENYFDRELMAIEREIRQLKTAQNKSAGKVSTVYRTISFRIPLRLNSSETVASGSAKFRVSVTNNGIIIPTMAKYYDDVTLSETIPLRTRFMLFSVGKLDQTTYLITVSARGTGGANSDVTTLRNGGSVVLDNTIMVQSTDNFTLEQIQ